jgi:hypothetical protein
LIRDSIITAVKYNSVSYFGNMQFHGCILHPVRAGWRMGEKTNPHARKVNLCQLSKEMFFENLSSQGKLFNIFSYSKTWK